MGFAVTFALATGAAFGFILLADPFDTLAWSPPFDRRPVAVNQRYALPGLARKPQFDSAVIGTSTVMLLDPRELGEALGGNFVTLAMGAATRHEQHLMLALFARHHARPKVIVFGLADSWIEGTQPARPHADFPFPAWMYDEDPWNDLAPHFDFYALRHAMRQVAQPLGLARQRFRADGYGRFVPDETEYDARAVHRILHETPRPTSDTDASRSAGFDLDALDALLILVANETEKILVIPPIHIVAQRPWNVAKRALVDRLAGMPNVRILDFHFPSPLTTNDDNYWDTQHYTVEVARRISHLNGQSRDAGFRSDVCRVLLRTGAGR